MKNLLLVFCVICFNSCYQSTNARIDRILSSYSKEGESKKNPIFSEEAKFIKLWKEHKEKYFKLNSLYKGSDDLEIRVWEDYHNGTGRLIELARGNEGWEAHLFKYKQSPGNEKFLGELISSSQTLSVPQGGWENLVNELLDLDILTLPDYTSLSNYDLNTDEYGVMVEIGAKDYYNCYEYPGYQYRVTEYPEAKKVAQIVQVLNKKFNLTSPLAIRKVH